MYPIINGYRFATTTTTSSTTTTTTTSGGGLPTTNLWAYYEADSGITQSSNNISQWADLSGNNHHWVQASSGNQPSWNGSNLVTFVGSNQDFMSISGTSTLNQPISIYAVLSYNFSSTGEATMIFGDMTNFSKYFLVYNSGGSVLGEMSANTTFDSTDPMSVSTYYLVRFVMNNTTSLIQVNNNTATNGSVSNSTSFSFTASIGNWFPNSSTLNIKGLYIYQGASANDSGIKSYTTTKWGVP